MKIHCLQNVEYEGPACIPDWAAARGYRCSTTRLDLQEDFPVLDDVAIGTTHDRGREYRSWI